jgi:hypothetical protein
VFAGADAEAGADDGAGAELAGAGVETGWLAVDAGAAGEPLPAPEPLVDDEQAANAAAAPSAARTVTVRM